MSRNPIQVAAAVVAAVLLVTAGVFGGSYLSLAAPFSGAAWSGVSDGGDGVGSAAGDALSGETTVENPYGEATVSYDADGVPHIEADDEAALYYAVGYVQARDRLWEMDLQRRLMAGNLSAAVGEQAVESDRFYRQMDFQGAAEASWEALEDTEYGPLVRAYTDGVNRYRATEPLPVEFRLNDYEPEPWTPTATLLVDKQISWSLSGDFRDLEAGVLDSKLGTEATSELYPDQLAHDSPVLRTEWDAPTANTSNRTDLAAYDALYESLRDFQREPGIGSNNWVVSGNQTASGQPLLANDPHLTLTVPPVWYEMRLHLTGDDGYDVRGVTFPGVPSVIIGQNRNVAWGVTNVGADVTDLYTYETPSNDTYVYDGEERAFETEQQTIQVSGGEDVTVTVRKTVHGAYLERETPDGPVGVGVAWTGMTGTKEALAIWGFNRAETVDDVEEAARDFDSPTQNLVAADRDGGTLYRATGKYPYRYTDSDERSSSGNRTQSGDGEVVRGDRVFDGSAGEGEWRGFTPFGQSSWEGFVPYEQVPHVFGADYIATANQRTADQPGFYLSTSGRYADPYRGERIYELLDRRAESGEPMDAEFMRTMQRDVYSTAAEGFVPGVLDSRSAMDEDTREWADSLESWDYNMTADSEAALAFALFRQEVRNATFYDEYHPKGLDEGYYPHLYVVQTLPEDSEWFDDVRTDERETRADAYAEAMERAKARADENGWETYGDYNRLDLNHPFPVGYLDYPERAMDGSPFTVFNFRTEGSMQAGSSWRMVSTFDGESSGVIPGGQSGNPFSPHYHDQLDEWAEGEYKPMDFDDAGAVDIRFTASGGDDGSDGDAGADAEDGGQR
ncbi:penicillin acylase family protein [Halomarina oriensis]|uniref:Penicillin acylase family protein n=1 Tax=Halomarina oriensis TaxID=671145 RepID=A0A6B0GJD3_9EURY|nr:penicillin acylase family protein [Halomarina oriensis]MWG33967.1 penicillin acylase family protein [Halomarina oriensis]